MSHIHLELKEVGFSYQNGEDILKKINFSVTEGETVGIIGENGAGKSTLLKLMAGLYTDFKGEVRIEDIPLQQATLPLIRQRVGYVFQEADSQLFMPTVYEDVAFAPANYGLPRPEIDRRVDEALMMVGAMHLKNRQTHKLSGGEKKMISIATILSMTPDIILMDEPSAALDPRNRRKLIGILNHFSHLKMIASHDLDLIMDTCSRIILIHEGEIIYDGCAETILHNKEMLEQYGLELPLSLSRR